MRTKKREETIVCHNWERTQYCLSGGGEAPNADTLKEKKITRINDRGSREGFRVVEEQGVGLFVFRRGKEG